MSRLANYPIKIPKGVEINLQGQNISVKGSQGALELNINPAIAVTKKEEDLQVSLREKEAENTAMEGTMHALIKNMIMGVTQGFECKLELVGVGYRAQVQGKSLSLTLGFSHPVLFKIPEDVKIETPSQTEILIKGCDKQKVGQVAADIRRYRPPEPYKGKGVKYADEIIIRKEGKKK